MDAAEPATRRPLRALQLMIQGPAAFIDEALGRLERALSERGDDLRNVQLATVSADGRPQLRTMVLRGLERQHPPRLELHSDARAAKVRDIAEGRGRACLLAWSSAEQLQLRFEGVATAHHDDALARERWDGLSDGGRKPYGLRADPGSAIDDPSDQPHLPPDEQARQFVVLRLAVASVDVLRLGAHGAQTRAFRRYDGAGDRANWIGA